MLNKASLFLKLLSNFVCINFSVSLREMKLVMLTMPDDGMCNLKVQSLPGWETVYNLQLNAPSMLAKCNTFQVCRSFSLLVCPTQPKIIKKISCSTDEPEIAYCVQFNNGKELQ